MSRPRALTLSAGAAAAVLRGHPWVWRDGVKGGWDGLSAGEVVQLRDGQGATIGQGLWDPSSPIAVRVYTRSSSPVLDPGTIVSGVERAIERRHRLAEDPNTTAYRLCHGEGDHVPGLVLDRYSDVAVLRLDGGALPPLLDDLADGLWRLLEPRNIRSLAYRPMARGESVRLVAMRGQPAPATINVQENGMTMVVDLAHGQKTGAFLDQRDNRARVRELAQGRRVLNLFSYAGGFSLSALLGGAEHATSVDIAQQAHATAQASMRSNGIDPGEHTFVTADVFAFLDSARKKKQAWDLIISDPPSFAPSEKAHGRAMSAYRKLHAACAAVLGPDGIFCASSCSSHVTAEDFASTLDELVLGCSHLSLVGLYGNPADHPTLPAWPEGRYLKFAILA